MATQRKQPTTKTEFIRQLTETGFSDFIVIEKDTAESILIMITLVSYRRSPSTGMAIGGKQ